MCRIQGCIQPMPVSVMREDLGSMVLKPVKGCVRVCTVVPPWDHPRGQLMTLAHASVNISCYKHENKSAKCPHIVYWPISAKIYLLATYSALAEIISCALYACRPTYILLRFMHSSQHICRRAFSNPADIYFSVLYAVQPTYIIRRCK